MEQAGISKLQLIENKDLTLRIDEDGNTILLDSGGNVFNYDGSFPFTFSKQESRNRNNKLSYKYTLGFTNLDATTIQKLRRSIYGYLVVFYFNDLTTKILPVPLLWDESPQNNNVSASYSVKMTNFVRTEKQLVPFGGLGTIPWILDTGFWDDEAYWIDSKQWID